MLDFRTYLMFLHLSTKKSGKKAPGQPLTFPWQQKPNQTFWFPNLNILSIFLSTISSSPSICNILSGRNSNHYSSKSKIRMEIGQWREIGARGSFVRAQNSEKKRRRSLKFSPRSQWQQWLEAAVDRAEQFQNNCFLFSSRRNAALSHKHFWRSSYS